jgi:hypothetical protein
MGRLPKIKPAASVPKRGFENVFGFQLMDNRIEPVDVRCHGSVVMAVLHVTLEFSFTMGPATGQSGTSCRHLVGTVN